VEILIIGGTRFLGRVLTDQILEKGYNLTLFNRGKSNPEIFPNVKTIFGDREFDLKKLEGKKWDAVIDTCGYVPRIVKLSVDALKHNVDRYIFISSVSVYKETIEIGIDETADRIMLEDPTTEDVMASEESYGGLKAMCEDIVLDSFGDRATIIRPGLIVGRNDPTHRFTYWPARINQGGEVIAPGEGNYPVQIIDVRDLASFILIVAENQVSGCYNLINKPINFRKLLETIKSVLNSSAELNWINEKWLLENEVKPWVELTCWHPSKEGEALNQISVQKAIDNGLQFHTLEDIIKDTMKWFEDIDGYNKTWSFGLSREKEHILLKKLQTKSSN
jgi:2'-hydroxyisoflavone reductase